MHLFDSAQLTSTSIWRCYIAWTFSKHNEGGVLKIGFIFHWWETDNKPFLPEIEILVTSRTGQKKEYLEIDSFFPEKLKYKVLVLKKPRKVKLSHESFPPPAKSQIDNLVT